MHVNDFPPALSRNIKSNKHTKIEAIQVFRSSSWLDKFTLVKKVKLYAKTICFKRLARGWNAGNVRPPNGKKFDVEKYLRTFYFKQQLFQK